MKKVIVPLIACLLCSGTAMAGGPAWDSPNDWVAPNSYVVDFDDDADRDEINDVLTSHTTSIQDGPLWEDTKIEIVAVKNKADLEYIKNSADIEGVEPLSYVQALGTPNDPLYEQQWHMKRINVESAWGYSVGRGAVVAVVDTGVACDNYSHFHKVSDLKQTECVPGYNFISNDDHANDDHGHGTHVAGTIAQSTNNKLGGVGVAYGVKLMPVKVLAGNGSGTNVGVAAGIRWAADNGAHIINMSLGGPMPSGVIQRAVNYARDKGSVIIAAAGNSGSSVGYPAACDGVIAVSATDQDDTIANFSSRGPEVDIAAPGVAVVQNTICDSGRGSCEEFPAWNGTSMATPHVAGVAALLVSLGVTDADAIEQALTESAHTIDATGANELYGAGLVQADAAVQMVHWKQTGVRFLMLFLLAMVAFKIAKKRGDSYSIKNPAFWISAVVTGVGALFFAPFIMSRSSLVVDVLSRPVGDWSLLTMGAGWHEYLPFANVLVPLVPTALLLRAHRGAGKWLAGIFIGTGAYLATVLALGQTHVAFGMLGTLWCAANVVLCTYVGSLLLLKIKDKK